MKPWWIDILARTLSIAFWRIFSDMIIFLFEKHGVVVQQVAASQLHSSGFSSELRLLSVWIYHVLSCLYGLPTSSQASSHHSETLALAVGGLVLLNYHRL